MKRSVRCSWQGLLGGLSCRAGVGLLQHACEPGCPSSFPLSLSSLHVLVVLA